MADKLCLELSERECEILRLVATGVTNQQIAVTLGISVNTVKAHLRNIFGKLGVESRTEATLYAIQNGLVPVAPTTQAAPQASPQEAAAGTTLTWPDLSQHLFLGQYVALVLALALVIGAVLWPSRAVSALPGEGRLTDLPLASETPIETVAATRWESGLQMPTPRGRFAQAKVDKLLYVIGGLTEEGLSAAVEVYDPAADLWERRASKPTAAANIGAAEVGGLIYVPGGYGQDDRILSVVEVYDPEEDTWHAVASLPVAMCAYAIAPMDAGFYLFGGWDGQHYLDTVWYYDVASDSWQAQPSLRVARAFAAASALRGRIYLTGGYDGLNEYSLVESFDPALARQGQDPWRTHAPMTVGRAGHSMVVADGMLYVVGGGWHSALTHNERYDAEHNVWATFETPISGEWRGLGLSAFENKEGTFLYALGGWSGRYLEVVQAYHASYRVFIP